MSKKASADPSAFSIVLSGLRLFCSDHGDNLQSPVPWKHPPLPLTDVGGTLVHIPYANVEKAAWKWVDIQLGANGCNIQTGARTKQDHGWEEGTLTAGDQGWVTSRGFSEPCEVARGLPVAPSQAQTPCCESCERVQGDVLKCSYLALS